MANKNGHWYTDKNGHHYFVEDGQSPKEGWEASKRRKMIDGGKYKVSDDGNTYNEVSKDEYDKFEADDADWDINEDDDFGFDEEEENQRYREAEEEMNKGPEDDDDEEVEEEPSNYEELVEAIQSKRVNGSLSPEDSEKLTQSLFKLNNAGILTNDQYEEIADWLDRLQGEVSDAKMKQIRNGQPHSTRDAFYEQAIKDPNEKDDKKHRPSPNQKIYEDQKKKEAETQPHNYEDFEDARYYPVTDEDRKNAGPRYLGRYHSIADAYGISDKKNWGRAKELAKPAGDYKGFSIYQLPDGYFSINPNITDIAFKSKEALQDYLDKKNPEEHKYGVYFEPGSDVERTYRGKGEDGKEYDMEAPDAYKAARSKNKQPAMTQEQRQAIREQINKMVASLDDARSLDEAWDIEEGIKELEDMLKKFKGK